MDGRLLASRICVFFHACICVLEFICTDWTKMWTVVALKFGEVVGDVLSKCRRLLFFHYGNNQRTFMATFNLKASFEVAVTGISH